MLSLVVVSLYDVANETLSVIRDTNSTESLSDLYVMAQIIIPENQMESSESWKRV